MKNNMPNIHTLDSLSGGHRLGSIRELELEEALRTASKSVSDIDSDYKKLQSVYSNFSKI
jgi:hypothetical protein